MKLICFNLFSVLFIFLLGCSDSTTIQNHDYTAEGELKSIAQKYKNCMTEIQVDSLKIPRSLNADRTLIAENSRQWTSGFFPGSLWQILSFQDSKELKDYAIQWLNFIEKEKYDDHTHDLGFKVNNSFGNACQVTKNEAYKQVVIQASKTLSERYNDTIGAIRSWDWGKDRWEYPVIIDNMMNLEMLFQATQYTGDSSFHNIAYQHALTTLTNHFRADHSSYHVIDYNPTDGSVRNRHTHQGYSHESAWSRGQAWGLYGFTKAYEYTGDEKFLDKAKAIVTYIFSHPQLPEDLIPYWDYDAPNIPNEPRDVSAATVTASALYDLASYVIDEKQQYLELANSILTALSQPKYKAEECPFILDHSVGSVPGEFEVDVPIVYADYYYIEALLKDFNN